MLHYYSLNEISMERVWLAIGAFDGVHLGHQKIIRQLTTEAHEANVPAVVLTFHPHPMVVVNHYQGPIYLTTPAKKAELLARLGVDAVITLTFDESVARKNAREFLGELRHHLGMRQLWAGYDFAMGKDREANAEMLELLGGEFGYTFRRIPAVRVDGEVVSSSQIRDLVMNGEMEKTATKLGRPYQIQGKVVRGYARGRTIGIPTANLETMQQLVIPAFGVYACWAEVQGKRWAAAVNVGVRPTFDGDSDGRPSLEAHLLDFTEGTDLYDRFMCLDFITCLRKERRFENPQDLVAQVHEDIKMTRKTLLENVDAQQSFKRLVTNGS